MSWANCADYALTQYHLRGGIIGFPVSNRWPAQHCMHISNEGVLTHYVPPGDLPKPWHALGSFDGSVITGDTTHRKPATVRVMWFGVLLLIVALSAWTVKHYWRKWRGEP